MASNESSESRISLGVVIREIVKRERQIHIPWSSGYSPYRYHTVIVRSRIPRFPCIHQQGRHNGRIGRPEIKILCQIQTV